MPQPTLQATRVVDPLLTDVLLGFGHPEFVGNLAFPPVPVTKRAGKIVRFEGDEDILLEMRRAPGANIATVQGGWDSDNYELYQDAIAETLPFEHAEEGRDLPFDIQQSKIMRASYRVAARLEYDQLSLLGNATQYPAANKVTLADPNRWTDANVDIQKQVDTAQTVLLDTSGMIGNTMIFSLEAFNAAKAWARSKNLIINNVPNNVTLRVLLDTFGVSRGGIAASGIRAAKGAPRTRTFLNKCWLGYVPDSAINTQNLMFQPSPNASQEMPSFGYTYSLQGYPMAAEPEYVKYPSYTWVFPVFAERLPVMATLGAGYLWSNVTA